MPRTTLTGSRIRERRIMVGMRQADLARSAGISASYLNLIEHNRRRIGGKLLLDIAGVLGVEPAQLSEGAEAALTAALREAAVSDPGGAGKPGTGVWSDANAGNGSGTGISGTGISGTGISGTGISGAEVDRVEEFAGRFPGWAHLLAAQQSRIQELEQSVEALSDRLTHDPHLAASLHDVLSTVTAIRSAASILVDTRELEPEWRERFHRNIHEDSARLAEGAQRLVDELDADQTAEATPTSPQEEVQTFLEAAGYNFAQFKGAPKGRLSGKGATRTPSKEGAQETIQGMIPGVAQGATQGVAQGRARADRDDNGPSAPGPDTMEAVLDAGDFSSTVARRLAQDWILRLGHDAARLPDADLAAALRADQQDRDAAQHSGGGAREVFGSETDGTESWAETWAGDWAGDWAGGGYEAGYTDASYGPTGDRNLGPDPFALAARLGVDPALVMRRLAAVSPEQMGTDGQGALLVGSPGLVICDASGTLLFRRAIDGFPLPRFGAACPLWPLFTALSRPMFPVRQRLRMGGRSEGTFVTYAVAQPDRPPMPGQQAILRSHMLIWPVSLGAQSSRGAHATGGTHATGAVPSTGGGKGSRGKTAANTSAKASGKASAKTPMAGSAFVPPRVGVTCRVCPRDACPARREPSIMGDGLGDRMGRRIGAAGVTRSSGGSAAPKTRS